MSSLRPTFTEVWYRVSDLRTRLNTSTLVRRQSFRGRPWYVLEDPYGNQFFRLHRSGYDFVARLDGHRTVDEAWRRSMDRLGDEALTQGEAVQLLGQLHAANLLQADVPPDVESLFRRYQGRRRRDLANRFANILFLRIPLFDPDLFLDRWTGVFGRLFGRLGIVVLGVLTLLCAYLLITHAFELGSRAESVLSPSALPLLYVGMVILKSLHELGHAFACKHFARIEGGGGEVHAMGIALLVFLPLPYVDASSAWGLRDRWHRAVVGAAGVLVEFAVAGLAAIVWANTGTGTVVNDLAYDFIWIASLSTLLFNANPLLRYDGYYILSDLLEIPNLAMRAQEHLHYLVKRYAWRVPRLEDPALTRAEARWLVAYGLAAGAFRLFVSVGILFFVADRFFFIGVVLAAVSLTGWAVLPLFRLIQYLSTDPELERVRARALATTTIATVVVLLLIGVVPFPEYCRVEAIAEARDSADVRTAEDGFVLTCMAAGTHASPTGPALVSASNPDLRSHRAQVTAALREARVRQQMARDAGDIALVQALAEQISAVEVQATQADISLSSLTLHAPAEGTWVPDDIDRLRGTFARRGSKLGVVATLDDIVVRATADQQTAARVIEAQDRVVVSIRPEGRPDLEWVGRVERILPAGSKALPSAALGATAGGTIPTATAERSGTEATERQFTILVAPQSSLKRGLGVGQRVVVRLRLASRPLLVQGWQAFRRLLQRRFHI